MSLSIVLRLQGLNTVAGPEDIRNFFKDIPIKEGHVWIVGGRLGEAFIMFTSERDGQRAFHRSGGLLRGTLVTLHISSLKEMERKITELENEEKNAPKLQQEKHPAKSATEKVPCKSPLVATEPLPSTAPPLVASPDATALILGFITALGNLHERESKQQEQSNKPEAHTRPTRSVSTDIPVEELRSRPGYVRLFGLPSSVTKQDICYFFKDLRVQEIAHNVELGLSRGCLLVKFADAQDASDALLFNNRQLVSVCVEVRRASEKMWMNAAQHCDDPTSEPQKTRCEPQEKPLYEPRERRSSSHTPPYGASFRTLAKSCYGDRSLTPIRRSYDDRSLTPIRRCYDDRSLTPPPKRPRHTPPHGCAASPGIKAKPSKWPRSYSASAQEYCVMVKNLPHKITKTEIKALFGCPNLQNKTIIHLLDRQRLRTDIAFVIFDRTEDFVNAMNVSGCRVGSLAIEVSSITADKMRAILAKSYPQSKVVPTAQTCLYVRNMPADVQKTDIMDLFKQFKLKSFFIFLLGEGEAVVQFKTEQFAEMALKLNGQTFLGSRVLLTRISVGKMEDLKRQERMEEW